MSRLKIRASITAVLAAFLLKDGAAEEIPIQENAWRVDAADYRFQDHAGRRSLYLYNGTAKLRNGQWVDGTIEFDVNFPRARGFVGLTFRRRDDDNFENFYFRSHQSGNPDATQYTPVFHNSMGWQIYHGPEYATAVEFEPDAWMSVKVIVSGRSMEVHLNGDSVLHVPDLKHDVTSGGIGFWTNETGAWFADLEISNQPEPFKTRPKMQSTAPPGTVASWDVSEPFAWERLESEGFDQLLDGVQTWRSLPVENNGIANLARLAKLNEGNTVFARAFIDSTDAGSKKVDFGFSDYARIYLNRELLYEGDKTYGTRDYRYLGTVGLFDSLYLPLRKGKNELVAAVRESFGGWAVAAAAPRGSDVQKVIRRQAGSVSDAIDALISAYVKERFGGAVIVADRGEVILDAGYGYAIRESEVPFTTDTVAQIGSLTKQFTAIAIIDLALKGVVDFHEPVDTYFEDAAAPASSATIAQLLTHSSGMPEYCGNDFDRLTLDGLLSGCMAQKLKFPPGTGIAYSNPGYSVLAAVVERVSGLPLEKYLKQEILVPNGLHDTGYMLQGETEPAHGYLNGRDMGVISERIRTMDGDYWALKGNGGMQSTARDMYRWYLALSGKNALTETHVKQFLTPRKRGDRENVWRAYGWGLVLDDEGCIEQVSHAGSDGVFYSYFVWRPQTDLFLYMVGNSGEAQVLEVIRGVRNVLFESKLNQRTGESTLDCERPADP